MANIEKERLHDPEKKKDWKKWGPYLTDRQWGTVREDYSKEGNAWEFVTHDDARSRAYRWGEEGIGGISDDHQYLCFAFGFWNGKDPIIKERFFGLNGYEGNHGEDVKEVYYYLDSTPTHSYMKMLYKYPQNEFPYADIVKQNQNRNRTEREYELLDSGIFDKDEYFDIFIEYAKDDTEDILIKATIHNRACEDGSIHVLPTVWLRNTWRLPYNVSKPFMEQTSDNSIRIRQEHLGNYQISFEGNPELLFCDNETNRGRLYGSESESKYFKDGINDYITTGAEDTIRPDKQGTKASGHYLLEIPAGESREVKVRLKKGIDPSEFNDFDEIFSKRSAEADEFYLETQENVTDPEHLNIQRQAYAGLMWTKQFYYYDIKEWLEGDSGRTKPPKERLKGRNNDWMHLHNTDIISMPDKWEYPWYAAWDLAFHTIPIARIDIDFAKDQLLVMLKTNYQHPNGQIPAYEWNFGDVNPPVHAWAALRVFHIEKKQTGGKGDHVFLEKIFHKLLLNFTWWINRKDSEGNNIFEGGFLGLDNIGVFDRSAPLPDGVTLEQADGTSWMAMYSLNMLRIALDLASENDVYEDLAIKFFEHFLYIAQAIHDQKDTHDSLWDEDDHFYYDVLKSNKGDSQKLKIRSMVGIIPFFAIETLKEATISKLSRFKERLLVFERSHPELYAIVSRWQEPGKDNRRLLSLMRGFRMKKLLQPVLDEEEFLSKFGIRALSKYHLENPYTLETSKEKMSVSYVPGESDSAMFGGNSNWRGPIWFPMNYLVVESLWKLSYYYDDNMKLEYPTGSGNLYTIGELADKLSKRLINIFMPDQDGNRPVYGKNKKFSSDPHFKDHILFYEYFHGDTGEGLGAAHQTGWTALVADLIHKYYNKN